jgi:hypothetical protein
MVCVVEDDGRVQCFDGWLVATGHVDWLRVIGERGMCMVAPRKANKGGAISASYVRVTYP